jgi:hypothetical protein
VSERLDAIVAARRRADTLARMRSLARTGAVTRPGAVPSLDERCDLCNTTIPDDHRHLLHLGERRIVCTCEACWALRSGDAEYRPCGMRTVWLDDFDCDDALWARFQIPIALAFLMRSTVSEGVLAFYPSPAGATESELDLCAWDELVTRNPALANLDADAEALVVNRLAQPHQYAIVPIDQCYALVGLVKSRWEGISGGGALEEAVPTFFAQLRARTTLPTPSAR